MSTAHRSAGATLLGRQTYDEFAGYWPTADPDDEMTAAHRRRRGRDRQPS